MKSGLQYHFEWDAAKAQSNRRKHGIAFEDAMTVFLDPLAVTRDDDEHAESEERWITVGQTDGGMLTVLAHTYHETAEDEASLRVISARRATPRERREYESGEYSIREPCVMTDEHDMKDEYDFSNGERGKFYRQGAIFSFPVYLDAEILAFFRARAKEQGVELELLLNEALQREITSTQARKGLATK